MTTSPLETPPPAATGRPRLRDLAFAAIAALLEGSDAATVAGPEAQFLLRHRQRVVGAGGDWSEVLTRILQSTEETAAEWSAGLRPAFEGENAQSRSQTGAPTGGQAETPHVVSYNFESAFADTRLLKLGAELGLTPFELLSVALAVATEDDAFAGRALARVQAPIGGARPTLGLLATAFAAALGASESPYSVLLNGAAVNTCLLTLLNETAPLPERAIAVPAPLCLALNGHPAPWPGVTLASSDALPLMLPPSTLREAARHAVALGASAHSGLLLRAGSLAESRAVAGVIARALGREAAFVETDKLAGVGPWLRLRNLLPVFVCELGPSERRVLPALPGYDGPLLALAGPDGGVETVRGAMPVWTLPVPPAAERETLWRAALGESVNGLAGQLAQHHRHGAGRIAQVGRLARQHASLRVGAGSDASSALQESDVLDAAWAADGGGLDSLAEPMRAPVSDAALVVPPALREQLELLALRCRSRDGLVEGLGPAATARYRPGVRALYTGPSGTGKTLAAGWLATRLGLPLYRVDLANVTSKYIGETEKNLAQLLARAEQAEVVLLFDEADSLFGKRTDIRDSNDRFANAQTNYLLQRIESYDGIVLLTSNSRARFDSAFARRLDCVLEFNLPSPDERRALWLAHLGEHHELAPAELNQLAALADVAGGHIRNAVLTAALIAREAGRKIRRAECVRGLEMEYRKIGRQLPGELEGVRRNANPGTPLPQTS